MKKNLLIILITIDISFAMAQGEVPVDMFTGRPSISIPFGQVTAHDLSDFFGLTYNAQGVAIKSSSGFYGTGWNLQYGGGKIVREVRGLPDDYVSSTDPRKGWLYSQSNTISANFGNSSDQNASTCSDELSDFNQISALNYLVDTEPDIFYYSAGGYSGSFVFDNSTTPQIRLIPFADVKIQPQFTDNKISAFVITTNDGVAYTYSVTSTETRQAVKYFPKEKIIDFKKTDYELYKTPLAFTYEWAVFTVQSPSGAKLTYSYDSESYSSKDGYDPDNTVVVRVKNKSYDTYTGRYLYKWKNSNIVRRLTSVQGSSGARIEFKYTRKNPSDVNDRGVLTQVSLIDNRRANNENVYVKEYILEYSYVKCGTVIQNCQPPGASDNSGYFDYSDYKRCFLRYISEKSGCDQSPPYEFIYYNTDLADGTTLLPQPNSLSIDFWGYYNGANNEDLAPKIYIYPQQPPSERYRISPIPDYTGENYTIPGADRNVNPATIRAGCLHSVKFPTGRTTMYEYEPNQYYDAIAGRSVYGPGLRVRSVIQNDGVNTEAATVKEFTYLENDGISSGRILYKPSYAVPMAQYINPADSNAIETYSSLVQKGMNPWLYLTARVDVDMAPQSGMVYYKRIKVSKPGAGYAVLEYECPGMWGDDVYGEWAPTVNKFARSSNCPSLDLFPTASAGIFPYVTNPNIGYAQGNLLSKRDFNDQHIEVSTVLNTYQYIYRSGSAASRVWGVQYHKMPHTPDAFYFSKYYLLTDVSKVLATQTEVVRAELDASKFIRTVKEYFYESNAHKLLTRTKVTESDGIVYTTRMKYPLDYGTVPTGADKASEMIGKLQTDFRNGNPIEVYSTKRRSDGTEKVIAGSVIKYHDFGLAKPLPHQYLELRHTSLPGIASSYINSVSKTFEVDSLYEIVNTVNAYTSFGSPTSETGQDRIVSSTGWGYSSSLPTVKVKHASPGEYVFSDFETANGSEFSIQRGSVVTGGRTGTYAIDPAVRLRKTLIKTSANYIFSGWIKQQNNTVNLTLKVMSVDGITVYLTKTNVFNAPGATYSYFEYDIPVTASVQNFMIEVQGTYTTPADGLYPLLDDVAFYPKHADLVSCTYAIPFGVNSMTLRNNTTYTMFDGLGRPAYLMDQDKNILQRNTYSFASSLRPILPVPYFTAPTVVYQSIPATFTAGDACLGNAAYYWDFGSGYQLGTRVQKYTFKTTGVKTIKLKLSHPDAPESREHQIAINVVLPD
jgi:hypothetical protein